MVLSFAGDSDAHCLSMTSSSLFLFLLAGEHSRSDGENVSTKQDSGCWKVARLERSFSAQKS
jgi:hypothetical protein